MLCVAVQSPHTEKLSFERGGAFIRDTRREVEHYLSHPRIRRSAALQLYAKAAVAFGVTLAAWLGLVVARPGLWLGLVCLAGIVFGSIITAFCVQHDANHGAYFRTRRANHLMGWTADLLLGFSSYTWRVKHNVAHHTYTNVDGYDDDIDQTPFLRLAPAQAPKPWYRLQFLYVWPLYCLMVLRMQIGGDVAAFVRGRIGRSTVHLPRRWDALGVVAGKAIFVGWALVVPLLVYPWWIVLAGYAGFTMAVSIVAATTFQLAHSVEDADTVTPEDVAGASREWAVHQVETTVDFAPHNRVLTWLLGGLNYQIEHHLFPRVQHTHYAHIAAIVQRNCARHGIRYVSQPSLWAALRAHTRHLRSMGRLGLPVELEMG